MTEYLYGGIYVSPYDSFETPFQFVLMPNSGTPSLVAAVTQTGQITMIYPIQGKRSKFTFTDPSRSFVKLADNWADYYKEERNDS